MNGPITHVGWLEWLRAYTPVIVVLSSILYGVGLLWLRANFPSKAEIARIDGELKVQDNRLDDHEKRIALVENECSTSPSRGELNNDMAKLGGRMTGVETGLRGVENVMATVQTYLRTLIERGLK